MKHQILCRLGRALACPPILTLLLAAGSIWGRPASAQICPASITAGEVASPADGSKEKKEKKPRKRRAPAEGTVEPAAVDQCGYDNTPPNISIDPAQGSYTADALAVTIQWWDDTGLDAYSYHVYLNGVDVTSQFGYSGYAQSAQSSGTITLQPGQNTLVAETWDQNGNYGASTATYTLAYPVSPPAPAPQHPAQADAAQTAAGPVHPGGVIRRDLCLTINAGAGADYECGDLRLVHEFPSIRVLNSERAPVLVYSSATAQPRPIVPFNLQMTAGAAPSAVRAILRVGPIGGALSTRADRTWSDAGWQQGGLWRFAIDYDAAGDSTNVYAYQLEIIGTFGGAQTQLHLYSGELAVVNRGVGSDSRFGAGWSLAGLERLVYVPGDGSFLRVGGDGSTQRYFWIAPGVWSAPVADRADTLYAYGSSEGSYYYRNLPNGSRVWYNPQHRHHQTVTRLGHITQFRYDGQGRLDLITLPKPAGTAVEGQYVFGYDDQNGGRLAWVCAVVQGGAGGNCRNTTMQYELGDRRITSITDPDGHVVWYGYQGAGREVRSRTDRNWARTTFTYGPAGRLRQSALPVPQAGYDIVHTFTPSETAGLSTATTAWNAYTTYDGPRTDKNDLSYFWVNRWGAPVRVQNARNQAITLSRTDPRFPALVTRVDYPSGRAVTAGYDARGNLEAETDWSRSRTLSNGATAYATTRYARTNDTWPNFVTDVTLPEGEVTRMGYHANGSRAWQQPGDDASRRVRFDYNSLGLVEWVTLPATATQGEARQRLEYDARGNLEYSTTPRGARTRYYNDELGRTWRTDTPSGDGQFVVQETSFYPASDRVEYTRTTSPSKNGAGPQTLVVRHEYDGEGRPTLVERWSEPDGDAYSPIGQIRSVFQYDAAGRRIAEHRTTGGIDSTYYDPAGNPVRVRTARHQPAHDPITMEYDELGRLMRRVVPQVVYGPRDQGIPLNYRSTTYPQCTGAMLERTYPGIPNDGCGYRIAADVQTFAYDEMGNVTQADNGDAQVRRSYNPDGSLKTDTLRIRTTDGADFTTHTYGLAFQYDLNGRRTQVSHPAQLAAPLPRSTVTYDYNPLTGGLGTVTDLMGYVFRHEYNQRGELQRRAFVDAVYEDYAYDADGALERHNVLRYNFSEALRRATLERDLVGRVLRSANVAGRRDTVKVAYTGMGHVLSTLSDVYGATGTENTFDGSESFSYDALGHLFYQQSIDTVSTMDGKREHRVTRYYGYSPGTDRLVRARTVSRAPGQSTFVERVDQFWYDGSGNQEFTTQTYNGAGSCDNQSKSNADCEDRASWYGLDGRLRAAEHRLRLGADADNWWQTTFEEYRYDALGRRVWVRSRMQCPGTSSPKYPAVPCFSAVRRTVWDGQQELWEIQMPGQDGSQYLENDTQPLPVQPYLGVWPTTSPPCPVDLSKYSRFDPNPHYGRVAYTHGLGIDQPVSLARIGLNRYYTPTWICDAGQPASFAPFAAVPLWDWRGQADGAVYAGGAAQHCQYISGTTRCVRAVPDKRWYAYAPGASAEFEWYGSVVGGKRDATGTMYRRARYYDPQNGRFTQEDPIGIAGGLNLYGYAGSDPVNYADPSGQSPILIGAAIGAGFGAGLYLATTPAGQRSWGGFLTYTGVGMAAGATLGFGVAALAPAAPAGSVVIGEISLASMGIEATSSQVITGTAVPLTFKVTAAAQKFYVPESATKHMVEALTRAGSSIWSAPVRGQVMLQSFRGAVEQAAAQGIVYGQRMIAGGWELVFQLPREAGNLPVIIHALPVP